MKAGAAYVPADYTAPASRNRTLLSDCTVTVVFLDAVVRRDRGRVAAARRPPRSLAGRPATRRPAMPATPGPTVLAHAPLSTRLAAAPDALAYILYTSGSTGVPKGVTLTQRERDQLRGLVLRRVRADAEQDRFSSHAPFHFDLSILDLYVPLKHGAALVSRVGGARQGAAGPGGVHRRQRADGVVLDAVDPEPAGAVRRSRQARLLVAPDRALRRRGLSGQASAQHRRRAGRRRASTTSTGRPRPTSARSRGFPAVIPPDRVEPYPIGPCCQSLRGARPRRRRRHRGPRRRRGPAAHRRAVALPGLLGPSAPTSSSSSGTASAGTTPATSCARP